MKYVFMILIALVAVGGGFLIFNLSNNSSQQSNVTDDGESSSSIPTNQNATPTNTSTLSEDESESSNTNQAEVSVTYDNNGFTPNTLGPITVGDSVKFRNESNQPLWVASNNHPTHTEYSEFDQNGSIKNGESWTFTFTRAGTWGYHNHLSPGDLGTIEVLAE